MATSKAAFFPNKLRGQKNNKSRNRTFFEDLLLNSEDLHTSNIQINTTIFKKPFTPRPTVKESKTLDFSLEKPTKVAEIKSSNNLAKIKVKTLSLNLGENVANMCKTITTPREVKERKYYKINHNLATKPIKVQVKSSKDLLSVKLHTNPLIQNKNKLISLTHRYLSTSKQKTTIERNVNKSPALPVVHKVKSKKGDSVTNRNLSRQAI